MHMKLLNVDFLRRGTPSQQRAHSVVSELKIIENLHDFSPVIAGTIPLDVDIESSDLDIICGISGAETLESFANRVSSLYGSEDEFKVDHVVVRNRPTAIISFKNDGMPLEIFAQAVSVFSQPAVIHMLVEARLLAFSPREAKEFIRGLKKSGLKTEPAFAQCFSISGDPYAELLRIANLPDREILAIAHRFILS